VTSPLKEVLYRIADVKSETAEKFQSANTLIITDKLISVHNTDLEGFRDLVAGIKPTESVAIWGGGGTLEMMKSVLPSAFLFSSQTAELRDKNSQQKLKNLNESLDYLIWAAPRTTHTRFPSETLTIKQIIDLNYTASSMGIELAALRNIPYSSGLKMFRLQALKQQQYWSEMTKG
jgi:shikimate 5-dehydrogenase